MMRLPVRPSISLRGVSCGSSSFCVAIVARPTTSAEYLSGSGKNLVEIARLTGYESDVALSKAFRRHFGAPPGTYRTRSLPIGAAPVAG